MLKFAGTALLIALGSQFAQPQTPPSQSFVGTITAFKPDTQVEIKPDNAAAVDVRLTPDTVGLRIAPGEKSLKNAEPAKVTELLIGDRVLVTLEPNTQNIRRIVIMSSADIRKRDEADRQDWNTRGISGVVTARNGNTISLRLRSFQGETNPTVTVSDRTRFLRYAPDSVKFADAKPSTLAEIKAGDQLRARGTKSPDGLAVDAGEVVFGTFLTVAGSVISIDPAAHEISAKEIGTGKLLSIKLTPESRIKQMPSFPAMSGPPPGAGGSPPGAGGPPAGAFPGGAPPSGGFNAMPPGGPPPIAQMVEMMPAGTLEDIKPGQTIVVSSTKGETADHVTAIILLTNAEMLVQMATRQAGGAAAGPANRPSAGGQQGMPPGGMPSGMDLSGALGGFGLAGIGP